MPIVTVELVTETDRALEQNLARSLAQTAAVTGAELQAEVSAVTHAIAQVTDRPTACVHIEYAPAAVGRVAFGGKLVQ